MFRDRHDAALRLAESLKKYKGQNPLILGIPRGGVVIGSVLARELHGDLDIILTCKLRAPGNPELAMGSIDENGSSYLNKSIVDVLQISDETIEEERNRQLAVIRRRAESYRHICPKKPLENRIVIITDDGIATGATMRAAIQSAWAAQPKRLVVALPVGPPGQVAELEPDVDEMVCIDLPPNFMAVGQFYESFDQVEDEHVVEILINLAKMRS
ncbi:MAG: phosphoribosyltransferase [Candidatus Hydrogenedentota bacterium]|nr:MAG: phosphoribosyltransferase [Candidatus Hydrogenedentota bacterium]